MDGNSKICVAIQTRMVMYDKCEVELSPDG